MPEFLLYQSFIVPDGIKNSKQTQQR